MIYLVLPGGGQCVAHDLQQQHMFPGLDSHYADTAQSLTTAGEELSNTSYMIYL